MNIKRGILTRKYNQILIPVNTLPITNEGAEEFNKVYKRILLTKYNKIVRTPSGGISYSTRTPAWDIRILRTCIELTVLELEGPFRLQFRSSEVQTTLGISGSTAFKEFKKHLLKYNIDLESYSIENGKEIKETIEKWLISLDENYKDVELENVHHLDYHSSFPAGIVNTRPEFKEAIDELYNKRKENPVYKAILNCSIGMMQSYIIGCKFAHIAKDAIKDNNDRIRDITNRLEKFGAKIILFNTDGIWYQSPEPYHGDGEGKALGQWENDHTYCKFRAKSRGAYEFIENNKYTAVVRGHTLLDDIKPRSEWKWGDIYNTYATVQKFEFDENEGIVKVEE